MSTGPKTEEGKLVVSKNATKHGVFVKGFNISESKRLSKLTSKLLLEEKASSVLESVIAERIVKHVIKLKRISKMEREYIKSVMDPDLVYDPVKTAFGLKVLREGYKPKFDIESVNNLIDVYSRYETTEENKLYRAINQLINIRNFRENK